MVSENKLEIRDLSVGFHKKGNAVLLLKGISLSVSSGKVVALMGKNGTGKTTLMRTLSGLDLPIQGRVSVNGNDLHTMPADCRASLVAMVLTSRPESFGGSVYELLSLGRSPYQKVFSTLSDHDHELIRRAIDQTGIGSLSERSFAVLSDGEKQRVMITRALVQDSPIVFLDEPTAFLDVAQRKKIMELLVYLARETGKIFILINHEPDLSLSFAQEWWLTDPENKQLILCKDKNDAAKQITEMFGS